MADLRDPTAYFPGEVLIRYKSAMAPSAREAFRSELRGTRKGWIERMRIERVQLRGMTVEQAVRRYAHDPRVEYVAPNGILRLAGGGEKIPNDSLFANQWALRNTGQCADPTDCGVPGADIHATRAWKTETGSSTVLIGVFDTGIDYNVPDLAPNVWTNPGEIPGNHNDDDGDGLIDDVHGYDFFNGNGDPFDSTGHGTGVAGIIAAVGNNRLGVSGVAWRAKLVAIRIFNSLGQGSAFAALQGMDYCITKGIRITNHSYTGNTTGLQSMVTEARNAGILVVAGAGNFGTQLVFAPALFAGHDTQYTNLLSVGGSDRYDRFASFSNFGPSVDLVAPGSLVFTTTPTANPLGYGPQNGTSYSAPHVTGAAALLLSHFPWMTAAQIRTRLLSTVDSLAWMKGLTVTGGRLNAERALTAVVDTTPPTPITDLTLTTASAGEGTLSWTAPGDNGSPVSYYELYSATGPAPNPIGFAGRIDLQPLGPGSPQQIAIPSGVRQAQARYQIVAVDASGNRSSSNIVAMPYSSMSLAWLNPAGTLITIVGDTLNSGDSLVVQARIRITCQGGGICSAAPLVLSRMTLGVAWDPLVPKPPYLPDQLGAYQSQEEAVVDAGGYTWDGGVAGGTFGTPSFSWVDISQTGTEIHFSGDEVLSTPVGIGFSFPFYGGTRTQLRVSSNGYLTFANGADAFRVTRLPDPTAPRDLIAPCLTDFDVTGASHVYVQAEGTRFIVTWQNVSVHGYKEAGSEWPNFGPYGPPPPPVPHNFQAILYPSGEIRFQYQQVGRSGRGVAVGTQNASGTVGNMMPSTDADALMTPQADANQVVRFVPLLQWVRFQHQTALGGDQTIQAVPITLDARGLPPGNYVAKLRATIGDAAASELRLNVTVNPPPPPPPPPDVTPPATSTITATLGPTTAVVQWIAPGDDGTTGQAAAYDLRYMPGIIDEATFSQATPISTAAPGPAGTPQCASVQGLSCGQLYSFALKTRDEAFNWSGMSNVASGTVGNCSAPEQMCDSGLKSPIGSLAQAPAAPRVLSFSRSSANPAVGPVLFRVGVPEDSRGAHQELALYDLSGRRIRTLLSNAAVPGWHDQSWDLRSDEGTRVHAGIYFARYHLGRETRRLTVVMIK